MAQTSGTPLDDIAYLARSEHRVPTLVALTARPRSRSELWEMAGVSSSTIRRTLTEYEERGWITKHDYKYEATELGDFIASAAMDLIERVETEQQIRDVWHLLPGEENGFSVEMCTDATVTVADAENPYRPLDRFRSLIKETDRVRFVRCDVALIEPCLEEFRNQALEGTEIQFIDSAAVVRRARASGPDAFADALDSGNVEIWVHDDLPSYGVGLLDDRTVVTGYDAESGTVRVLVDTDSEAAKQWAESIYRTYRRQTPTVPLPACD